MLNSKVERVICTGLAVWLTIEMMKRNQRGFGIAGGLIILIALGLIMGVSIVMISISKDDDRDGRTKKQASQNNDAPVPKEQLMRICPEHWYKDEMPGIEPRAEESREYFIIGGNKVEKKEVDVEWVKKNCVVKEPEIVQ